MPERDEGATAPRDNRTVLPPIEFPEALPVSARRDVIAAALAVHQAIVV